MKERKNIRLRDYDYSRPGAYFVTICVRNRQLDFGEIVGDNVSLSPIGDIAGKYWREIPQHFPDVDIHEYVVMPNHIHGIIVILDGSSHQGRGVQSNTPTENRFSRISPARGSLAVIVRAYKGAVTRWCRQNGYPEFRWQRGYYDHIIRNEESLSRIREYITNNPRRWAFDRQNAARQGNDDRDP